jgi:parallel beta-helix repeat protein
MLAFHVQPVRAEGTIYIRADGSIDPPDAPIQRNGDVYTVLRNITSNIDGIVIERDGMKLDGAGYAVQGTFYLGSRGIYLGGRSNVTITNMRIKGFECGIKLVSSSNNSICENSIEGYNGYSHGLIVTYSSNYNSISGNNVTNSACGIVLTSSSNNVLSGNMMIANTEGNLAISGSDPSDFMHSIDTSNEINGKPVYYLANQKGVTINHTTHPNIGFLALVNSSHVSVEGLTIDNGEGLLLAYVNNSRIAGNNMTNNWNGVRLVSSSNNSISGNRIASNRNCGMKLDSAFLNTVSGNCMTNNSNGVDSSWSSLNTFSGNNITDSKYDGLFLYWSSNNTLNENEITNNDFFSVGLYYSSNNTILGNRLANNNVNGIELADGSNYNHILENNIINNEQQGIFFCFMYSQDAPRNNTLYHNNFINNTSQVTISHSTNAWDNGCEGNYWSDYNGTDSDQDGVGNTPYVIDVNNTDRYPLMNRYWVPADLNHDLIVNIFDVVKITGTYGATPASPYWNPHADIAEPYGKIDIFDVVLCTSHYGKKNP